MEKSFKISSTSLSSLNETLTNLNLNEKITNFTPVIVEADGKFTSVIKTDSDFDPESLGNAIDAEEENEENKETKQQLLNKATEALKQTVANSKELDEILKKIKKLSQEDGSNEWKVNDKGNTAVLKDKNAYIFKQNDYLCLSHNGKIELFRSVDELRKWLEDNNYPLPDCNIEIHESVEVKEEEKRSRNWYDLLLKYKEKQKAEYKPSEENKEAEQVEECFGGAITGTANLGSAVTFLGNKKQTKKKQNNDEQLKEGVDFANPERPSSESSKTANKLATALKNPDFVNSIKQGKITFPKNLDDYFMAFQSMLMDYNKKAFTSDTYNKAINFIKSEILKNKPQVNDEQIEDAINNSEKYEGLSSLIQSTLTNDKVQALSDEEQIATIKNVVKNYFNQENFTDEDYQTISDYMNNYVLCVLANKKPNSLEEMKQIASAYLAEHPEEQNNFVNYKSGDSLSYSRSADDNNIMRLSREGNRDNRSKWQNWYYNEVVAPKDKVRVDRLYHALFDPDSNVALGAENPEFTKLANKYETRNNVWYTRDMLPNIENKKDQKAKEEPDQTQEFSPEFLSLCKAKNIDPKSDRALQIWKMLSEPKEESKLQVFESASKYSWLGKVLGKRLVEDDSPADFATGTPLTDPNDVAAAVSDTSTTDTTTDSSTDGMPSTDPMTGGDTGNGFGDINISAGNYSPEGDEEQAAPMPNMPEYEIIDVLENENNPDDIKVKVRNKDTAKVEIKPLSEIDV